MADRTPHRTLTVTDSRCCTGPTTRRRPPAAPPHRTRLHRGFRMRKYLAALAVAGLLLAGCNAGAAEDPGADAGAPVQGGKLTWAIETEPVTFNPHQYAQAKARLLVWNSFEGL